MSIGHGATIGYGEEGSFLTDGQSVEGDFGQSDEEARFEEDNTNEGPDGEQEPGAHESA